MTTKVAPAARGSTTGTATDPDARAQQQQQQTTSLSAAAPCSPQALELTRPRTWRNDVAQVTWSIVRVLRSSCTGVAFGCAVMFCFSAGNIFSGDSPNAQSTRTFVAAMVMWAKFINWLSVAALYAVSLVAQRFVAHPDVQPRFVICWLKVLRGTVCFIVSATGVMFAIAVALLHVPAPLRELRLHFYAASLWHHLESTLCNIETTRIFDNETVRGRAKQLARQHHRPRTPFSYWKHVSRVFVRTSTSMASYIGIALYAHVASRVHLVTATQLLVFMAASVALKNALQMLARVIVFKRRVQNLPAMAVIVGIPTILIDTQMRIVLLRAQSTSATLSGTLVMAAIEISTRCFKSFYVGYEIKREQAKRQAAAALTSSQHVLDGCAASTTSVGSELGDCDVVSYTTPAVPPAGVVVPPMLGHTDSFSRWRQRLLYFHATKVYIDIAAEYVALGCSFVILCFCWSHPKFMLSQAHSIENTDDIDSSTGANALDSVLGGSQAIVMVIQLGAELAVDFVSCLLELRNGIDFGPVERQSFFLVVFLVWAAVGNIAIAAFMFVRM